MDIHSPQTEGFFSIPVDCLTARFLFERWVMVSWCQAIPGLSGVSILGMDDADWLRLATL